MYIKNYYEELFEKMKEEFNQEDKKIEDNLEAIMDDIR